MKAVALSFALVFSLLATGAVVTSHPVVSVQTR